MPITHTTLSYSTDEPDVALTDLSADEVLAQFIGSTILSTDLAESIDSDRAEIVTSNGKLVFWHQYECCEGVYLTDVGCDPADLVGGVIVSAEEVSNVENPGPRGKYDDSYTWTFYKINTTRGDATLRWYGTSNGYYSESMDVRREA